MRTRVSILIAGKWAGSGTAPVAKTYTEVLDVVEDLVVQGKVVGGDDVDTGILLDLPVGEPQPLGLGEELILGDLAAPVCGWLSAIVVHAAHA